MARAVRYRAYKRHGRWYLGTDAFGGKRPKPFAVADTLAGVLDCPQLQLLRDKKTRMAGRYGRPPAMTLQEIGRRAIRRARGNPSGFDH